MNEVSEFSEGAKRLQVGSWPSFRRFLEVYIPFRFHHQYLSESMEF